MAGAGGGASRDSPKGQGSSERAALFLWARASVSAASRKDGHSRRALETMTVAPPVALSARRVSSRFTGARVLSCQAVGASRIRTAYRLNIGASTIFILALVRAGSGSFRVGIQNTTTKNTPKTPNRR